MASFSLPSYGLVEVRWERPPLWKLPGSHEPWLLPASSFISLDVALNNLLTLLPQDLKEPWLGCGTASKLSSPLEERENAWVWNCLP